MRNCELVFRDRLDNLIGKYCPNDAVLNTLAFFLFQEVVDTLRTASEVSVEDEVQNTPKNMDIELPSFMGAVKDLSAFSAQRMASEAIKKAFHDIKSSVPLVQRGEVATVDVPQAVKRTPVQSSHSGFSQNAAEFDIDISEIPRVDVSQIKQQVVRKPVQSGYASNVFSGDIDISLDEINMRTPTSRKASVRNEGTGDGEDVPTLDASQFTDGTVYTGVPKVSVDLDY